MNPSTSSSKPLGCGAFRERIFDFQADELSEVDRDAFAGHRDACPACARRLEVEEALLGALRAGLPPREAAPPALEARVREALCRAAPDSTPGGWPRARRWAVPLAASVLLAFLLWPGRGRELAGHPVEVHAVDEEVLLVDLVCDRSGRSLGEQIACSDPSHLNALKIPDGGYWNLSLEADLTRALVLARELRGHRLRVRGELYREIETLRLTGYDDLGRASAAAVEPARSFLVARRLPARQPRDR